MASFSSFSFQGDGSRLRIRVSLKRCARVAGLPSFAEYSAETERRREEKLQQQQHQIDEIQFAWAQKVEQNATSGVAPGRSEHQRLDPRLFTVLPGDGARSQNAEPTATQAPPNSGAVTDKKQRPRSTRVADWHQSSPIVEYGPARLRKEDVLQREEQMLILASTISRQPADRQSTDDDVVVCTIVKTATSLTFYPELTNKGYKLDSRHGAFVAFVSVVDDDDFREPDDESAEDALSLSEDTFQLSPGKSVQYTYFIDIKEANGFVRSPLQIEYLLKVPSYLSLTPSDDNVLYPSDHTTDSTSSSLFGCTPLMHGKADQNGGSFTAKFAHAFEATFVHDAENGAPAHKPPFWPQLLFRISSRDSLGRAFLVGCSSYALPLDACEPNDDQNVQVPCYKPHASDTLRESIVGTPAAQFCPFSSVLDTEPAGTLILGVSRLVQSRLFVTSEVMRRLKYGTMLTRIGLNTALHWRILKVLIEFEAARQELLKIRARHHNK